MVQSNTLLLSSTTLQLQKFSSFTYFLYSTSLSSSQVPIAALSKTMLVKANMIANSFTHHKKFLIVSFLSFLLLYHTTTGCQPLTNNTVQVIVAVIFSARVMQIRFTKVLNDDAVGVTGMAVDAVNLCFVSTIHC